VIRCSPLHGCWVHLHTLLQGVLLQLRPSPASLVELLPRLADFEDTIILRAAGGIAVSLTSFVFETDAVKPMDYHLVCSLPHNLTQHLQ
jgi:hypothetical protein